MHAVECVRFDQPAVSANARREIDVFLPRIQRKLFVEAFFANSLGAKNHVAAIKSVQFMKHHPLCPRSVIMPANQLCRLFVGNSSRINAIGEKHPISCRDVRMHSKKIIDSLKTEQARGSFDIAQYYERKHRWQGAKIYYNEVLQKDPESKYARIAAARIVEINKRTGTGQ